MHAINLFSNVCLPMKTRIETMMRLCLIVAATMLAAGAAMSRPFFDPRAEKLETLDAAAGLRPRRAMPRASRRVWFRPAAPRRAIRIRLRCAGPAFPISSSPMAAR